MTHKEDESENSENERGQQNWSLKGHSHQYRASGRYEAINIYRSVSGISGVLDWGEKKYVEVV